MKNLTKRLGLAVAVLGLMAGASGQAKASQIVTWTGNDSFDNESISFASFIANEITGFSGGGIYHNHSGEPVSIGIDVHINGIWVTVRTTTIPSDNATHPFSSIAGPLTFFKGSVDGLRLTSTPISGNSFHNMRGLNDVYGTNNQVTSFTFDTSDALFSVPEPSSIALVFTALPMGLGLAWKRRRMVKAA